MAAQHPAWAELGVSCRRAPHGAGEIAITIDDGPDPKVTPRVLDLLDVHGVQASFFCIGERAMRHPGRAAKS